MNATLKRVLFGMLLVVVGVLVWNASTAFPAHERRVAFSDFMADVDSGKVEQGAAVSLRRRPGSPWPWPVGATA